MVIADKLMVIAYFLTSIAGLLIAWQLRAKARRVITKYVLNTSIIVLNITVIAYMFQVFAITLP